MQIITLDYESFYNQEFGLSKLTTEEYIRDPRFEVIGVAIKVNDEKTEFFSGNHAGLRKKLLEYEMHKHAVIAHNCMFDMAILNWVFGIRPKVIFDTLSMARALHGVNVGNSLAKLATMYELGVKGTEVVNAKGKRRADFTRDEMRAYGNYCKNDVDLTYALFWKLRPYISMQEMKVIDITVRMFTEPELRVNVPMLKEHLAEIRERKKELLGELHEVCKQIGYL